MGLTRISSDGSLPLRNWVKLTVTLATNNVAQPFAAVPKLAIRALVYAPGANVATVSVAPSASVATGDDPKLLAKGDEYLIESEPGHVFDLAAWFAVSATAAGTTLVIFYQAA